MKKTNFIAVLLAVATMYAGCSTSQNASSSNVPTKTVNVEPVVVTASRSETAEPAKAKAPKDYKLPVYNPSATRVNDLLHTKLEVSFDWAKQYLYGKATIRAKPYSKPVNELALDAKSFEIKSVAVETGGKQTPLKYTYKEEKLTIQLDRMYQPTEEYTVFIDYIAKPEERKAGGSAAITSDKGLYFINPLGKEKDKPQQIWTQGETESNSCWFPTIDKPNERMTNEIYMTVENKYKTLSNGILKSSKQNPDGTRTDHWVMDLPHTVYLLMMAVGDFAIVKDKWRDKELLYYVEPKYEPYAKQIYNHTPEMLEFFSKKLGVDYPWQKYAQIIVRDYVSGAMENTTAVIFGDFCQKDDKELAEENNDRIVAHEMFHHWFGDLVTAENWANLTVNESFANMSESLWMTHKYGKDEGDLHRYQEMQGYLQGGPATRDLVHFGYQDKEEMFDGVSYNKGGCILYMLNNYLGDDLFFKGLKTYLTDNKFNTGEAHQLRLAFESVSGEDLNWFFNQWYFGNGHPNLTIDYSYNETQKEVTVSIKQTQDPEKFQPIYQLPIAVDVYESGKPTRHKIMVNQREQTFTFPAATRPQLVNVDADKILVGTKKDNHTEEEWAFMFYNAPNYLDRFEAIRGLKASSSPAAKKVLKDALMDKFWGIRNEGLGSVDYNDTETLKTVASIAQNDIKPASRMKALRALVKTKDKQYIPLTKSIIEANKEGNGVIAAAMELLASLDSKQALVYAKKMESNPALISTVTSVYAETGDKAYVPYFEENMNKVQGYESFDFFDSYLTFLKKQNNEDQIAAAAKIAALASNTEIAPFKRFAAAQAIKNLKDFLEEAANTATAKVMADHLAAIRNKETNEQLKKMYSSW